MSKIDYKMPGGTEWQEIFVSEDPVRSVGTEVVRPAASVRSSVNVRSFACVHPFDPLYDEALRMFAEQRETFQRDLIELRQRSVADREVFLRGREERRRRIEAEREEFRRGVEERRAQREQQADACRANFERIMSETFGDLVPRRR